MYGEGSGSLLSTGSDLPCSQQVSASFSPEHWRILAAHWHPVALSHHLSTKPLAVTLLDQRLVIHRTSSGVALAAVDRCPHRGAALSGGAIEGDLLVCPYHGFRFDSSGRCVMIPSDPGLKPPARLRLQLVPAREAYGLIWVKLLVDSTADLPPFDEWSAPGYLQVQPDPVDWAASAGRQIESFIDVSHFAFVHRQSFGEPYNTIVPAYHVVPTADGFQFDYVSTVSNYPIEQKSLNPEGFLWSRFFRVTLPFCVRLTITFPCGGLLHILNVAAPMSPVTTRVFSVICRNFDPDLPRQAAIDFNNLIFAEDRQVVEQQNPCQLPLDPRQEVHVPADLASATYRQLLRGMGLC